MYDPGELPVGMLEAPLLPYFVSAGLLASSGCDAAIYLGLSLILR